MRMKRGISTACLCLAFLSECNAQQSVTSLWEVVLQGAVLSSPALANDGTIYVGSQYLYAINPNGTVKWTFAAPQGFPSAPAIGIDGTIYIGSYDNKLYAINPDGTKKWDFETGGNVQTSPVITASNAIFVGSEDGNFYILNPDGTEQWRSRFSSFYSGSPGIGPDGSIYVSGVGFVALTLSGIVEWRFPLNTSFSSPAVDLDGTVYIGIDCICQIGLFALNPDGTEKWRFNKGNDGTAFRCPVIGADGTVYIAGGTRKLFALNPGGMKKWEFYLGDDNTSQTGYDFSPAIAEDGTIYFGCWNNILYALNPDGIEKWRFVAEQGISTSPVIAPNGVVYVGSFDYAGPGKLYALQGSSGLAKSPWPMFKQNPRHTGRDIRPKLQISRSSSIGVSYLTTTVEAGSQYAIEVSTNASDWTVLTNFVSTNSMVQFVDSAATNSDRRFYRMVSP